MGSVRLGEKKTRRIANATGLDVIRAWGRGDPAWFQFVTRDHRHGVFNQKSGEWELEDVRYHFDTCRDIDPSEPSGYRSAEVASDTRA